MAWFGWWAAPTEEVVLELFLAGLHGLAVVGLEVGGHCGGGVRGGGAGEGQGSHQEQEKVSTSHDNAVLKKGLRAYLYDATPPL